MGKYRDHRDRRGKRRGNAAKGFGFVKLPDGAEAYLHGECWRRLTAQTFLRERS
ncbi:MAG: hypothetical protein KDK08_15395 [Rhizobiaceae bacterium]|nr:hypothetical protein [Rhizobiaceae bacterium]